METITINVDETLKKEAESVFANFGITMSDAINVFFHHTIKEKAMPFKITRKEKNDPFYSESNMRVLRESIAQLKAGDVVVKTMEELEAMASE